MKRSAELRPARWDAAVAAVILLLAALSAGAYWTRGLSGGGLTAVVSVNGTETERVELSALSGQEERTYTGNGYTLRAVFSPSGVWVAQSDCPNQDCVHTGAIHASGQSVVCLPARISIQLTGNGRHSGVDAVIG